ncbi:unnamed protein product [Owenia fusiformis]|uniref:Uncharacterized protein n=1 Tax=Owenia fusiformis TaxID=6347 RepID=A0A8J1XY20_OWEFU|nr:unnamed protein product [Owenia fusiformis]
MTDILNALKTQDFPKCTQIALCHIETLLASCRSIPGLGDPQNELAHRITQEYVFCQHVSRKGGLFKKLTAIQEIQLCELLLQHFGKQQDPSKLQALFNQLFDMKQEPYRLDILCKMVSMAIGLKSAPVLNATGAWLQIQGPSKPTSAVLVGALVLDYCQLIPDVVASLHAIIQISPRFTHSFLMAASMLYDLKDNKENNRIPPDSLVEVITDWLASEPSICYPGKHSTPRQAPSRPSGLWNPGIDVEPDLGPESPIPGFVNWCVRAPLIYNQDYLKLHPGSSIETLKKTTILYSKLHLALLHTIHLYGKQKAPPSGELLRNTHMLQIASNLGVLIGKNKDMEVDLVDVTLDRLAQIYQVAMATGAMKYSKDDITKIVHMLPSNKLFEAMAEFTVGH